MTQRTETEALYGGVALLERSVSYGLGCLRLVTPDALSSPTPCSEWDLRSLLRHVIDSLGALYEASRGAVELEPGRYSGPDDCAGLVGATRQGMTRLLGAWAAPGIGGDVFVADAPVTCGILTAAGALEIAAHSWDIARACGQRRDIPEELAEEMLELAPLFVTGADRPRLFGPPVAVPPLAGPSDRLLAFLGRRYRQE